MQSIIKLTANFPNSMPLRIALLTAFCMIAPIHLFAQHSAWEGEATELLSAYLQIPSVTGNENEAGEFLMEKCRKAGFHIKIFTDKPGQLNFAASAMPLSSGKPNIVLLHHIDVVPAGDTTLWDFPPYSGAVHQDTIWGRGTLDCKGLGIMQFMALKNFLQDIPERNLPFNITLLCVSGEETGGHNGAAIVVEKFLKILNPSVVLGEGGAGMKGMVSSDPSLSVFGISTAEKKSLWLELELSSKKYGHGATPPAKYVNKTMFESLFRLTRSKPQIRFVYDNKLMFKEVGRLEKGLKGWGIRHIHSPLLRPFVTKKLRSDPNYLALVSNTVVVSQIQNPPGPPNQIANRITATLDCRLLPGTNTKAFLRNLKSDLKKRGSKIRITVLEQSSDAKGTHPEKFYEMFSQSLTKNYIHAATVPLLLPATTDNSYFRAKGIPVYGIMPIMVSEDLFSTIHGVNERIALETFFTGIKVYHDFLNMAVLDKRGLNNSARLDD